MNILLNDAQIAVISLTLLLSCLVLYIIVHRLVHNWLDRAGVRRRGRYAEAAALLVAGEIDAVSFVRRVAPGDRLLVEALLLEYAGKFSGEVRALLTEAFAGIGAVLRNRRRTRSRFWWHRADAASRLGLMGGAGSDRVLRPLLKDPHIEVRIAAARALVGIRSQDFLDELIQSLGAPDVASGMRIADVILEAGPAAVPHLIRFVQSAPDQPGVALALDILGDMQAPEAVAVVGEAVTSPAQEVRAAACRALGRIESPAAVPLLCKALRDPAWEVRSQAVQALGRIGDPGALPDIMPVLAESTPWTVYNAAVALRRMGREGTDALTRVLATHAAGEETATRNRLIIQEVLALQSWQGGNL